MKLLNTQSLAETVNAVEETRLRNQPIARGEGLKTAQWIAARAGMNGGYAGMPAPTPRDLREGGLLFTGERLKHAACRHVFGEEACRALIRLHVNNRAVTRALYAAQSSMLAQLHKLDGHPAVMLGSNLGVYCCGTCSVAVWRHLSAGGLDRKDERLAAGMQSLRAHRDGTGGWRIFPFWYAVLALSEIELPQAIEELKYAAPRLERVANRRSPRTVTAQRRLLVAERALSRAADK